MSNEVPAEVPVPVAAQSERLQTIRTLVIGVVIIWVVLVLAWAMDKAFTAYSDASRERNAEEARRRLASVGDLAEIFNEVSAAVEPAVVKLDVRRPEGSFGRFGAESPEANSGSGVIVEVDKEAGVGYIVTNEHVVDGAQEIVVTLQDGRRAEGRIVGTDLQTDIAVVRIRAEGLIPAVWGDSNGLRKGDWVVAFGSPFGFVGSMTAGIVSALDRERDAGAALGGREAYTDYIQTDAAINPGNSGGPLTNVQGEIIGINTAIFTRTGDFSGIGFAIPSNQAKRIFDDIRLRGRAVRSWLGANLGELQDEPKVVAESGYSGSGAVVVTQVYRNMPADKSGLQVGDIITGIDGQDVDTARNVRSSIAFLKPGTNVDLNIFRDGESLTLPVVLDEQPPGDLRLDLPPVGSGSFGLTLADGRVRINGATRPMVQIESVASDSPAARAGLQPRDQILAVDGIPVEQAEDAEVLLRRRGVEVGVKLRVAVNGRPFTVFLAE